MKNILVMLAVVLASTYSNATEICKSTVPQTNSVNIFIFNGGLQAVCQKIINTVVTDNKNICANDMFLLTSSQSSSSGDKVSVFNSYSTNVVFTDKQTTRSRTLTLDKVYRVEVLSGAKEIVIQPGTFAMDCQTK